MDCDRMFSKTVKNLIVITTTYQWLPNSIVYGSELTLAEAGI